MTALVKDDEIVETLYDRILGRVTVSRCVSSRSTGDMIIKSGDEIDEQVARS